MSPQQLQIPSDISINTIDDRVTVGITHEIIVNGDKSWVKLEYSGKVDINETSEDTIQRVSSLVNTELLHIITNTVKLIEENQ